MGREQIVVLLLRLGLASVFLYPPVAAVLDPLAWIGFFPDFLRDLVQNDTLLLHAFGAVEVAIGIWLLSGWRIFPPSIAAAAMLLGIIVFNLASLDIVFRDIGLLAMALALAVWSYPAGAT